MKNIAYILLGIIISFGLTATAYYIQDEYGYITETIETITDFEGKDIVDKFSIITATTTFSSVAEVDKARLEYNYQQETLKKLDTIIVLLTRISIKK